MSSDYFYYFSFLGEIITSGHSVYYEDMRRNPQGLIKEMLQKFGADFRDLLELPGVHSIKYLVSLKKLEIISSEDGFQQVCVGLELNYNSPYLRNPLCVGEDLHW